MSRPSPAGAARGPRRSAKARHTERSGPAATTPLAPAPAEALENSSLAMASAVMLGAPFVQPALAWLHWVALVPWVILVTREPGRARWPAFVIATYAFAIMAWGPFSIFSKVVPFALGVLIAIHVVPFGPLLRLSHTRLRIPLTAAVPVIWVALEWIRSRLSVGEVGLFPIGATQFDHLRLIQVADLGGVSAVSFLVAAVNGALAEAWVHRRRGWKRLWPVTLAPTLLVAANAYGALRLRERTFVPGPRIAVVQPNEIHSRNPQKARAVFERQLAFTRAEVPAGSADLIIWPENAVDGVLAGDSVYGRGLAELAREKGAAVVTGAYSLAAERPYLHTSAYHLSPEGEVLGTYHKLHLIPWSEYLPLEQGFLRSRTTFHRWHRAVVGRLTGFSGMGLPGTDLVTFSTGTGPDTVRFATPICFEIVNSRFARAAAAKGADFLINITSEGILGPPVYVQTWAFSTFRAIENRAGVVRAGNNGISGFIDPNGRTQRLVRGKVTGRPFLEKGVVIDRVQIDRERRTFYSRFGDVFAYLCVAATAGLLCFALVARRRSSQSIAPGT
jgi:apolipoprotein N-acyltransferase